MADPRSFGMIAVIALSSADKGIFLRIEYSETVAKSLDNTRALTGVAAGQGGYFLWSDSQFNLYSLKHVFKRIWLLDKIVSTGLHYL